MNKLWKTHKVFVIGLGHRARQGKDTVANFIQELRPNVHILHFADALYEEVRNKERKYPLIVRAKAVSGSICNWVYFLYGGDTYTPFFDYDVPYLNELFNERDIDVYWGMDEKDASMLQFWGTQFRRKQNLKYWVNKVHQKIDVIMHDIPYGNNKITYILVPDTRFVNEVELVQSLGGFYVRVIRTNEDGSQYLDASRDPNHASEVELNDVEPYITLQAKSGDLAGLKQKAIFLLNTLESLNEIHNK